MKNGRTLVSLAQELERQLNTKKDLVVPSALMRHDTDDTGQTRLVVEETGGPARYGVTPLILSAGGFASSIMPVSVLGVWVGMHLSRVLRGGLLEELHEPYITTLWAKGLRDRRIFYVHALRNALITTVTYFGVLLGELLSGTVVIETLFARQGLGRAAVEAIGSKDLPVVQGAILLASVTYVVLNLLIDLSYVWIDPRLNTHSAGAR
jgi:ABC-type dipeptide/oligopeptide/nickel transport system permease component